MLYEGNNIMTVKRSNRSTVLKILHQSGDLSRKRLSEITRLTPAAITKITSELIEDGLIYEGNYLSAGNVGRREVLISLDPCARCALGIHLKLKKAILSAVWLDGTLIFEEEVLLPEYAPANETIHSLTARLMELAEQYIPRKDLIIGIGIAARGIQSEDLRYITNSYHTLDEKNIPIVDMVEAQTGLPAMVEGNVRALLNSHIFLSRDFNKSSIFFLRCEYGIGGALSINNTIWRGSSGQCSEIGHIPVMRSGGKHCKCGKCGCLETVASPIAIVESALEVMNAKTTPVLYAWVEEHGAENLSIDDVFLAASFGDEPVCEIVNRAVIYLAAAVKAVTYSIDPQKIVLYGRMFENEYFLAKFNAEMQDNVDPYHRIPIEKSPLNKELENRAAPLLAITEFIERGGIGTIA